MDCLDANAILDFLDGTGPRDTAPVAQHLAGCAECRALVAAMTRGRTADRVTAAGAAAAVVGGEAAPAQIGRFVLEDVIGRGGMGVVYRAWDPELQRRVALKRVRPQGGDRARTEQARARLLREARALARLADPHVVAIHDVGVHDGDVTIAMEYVAGANLRLWLAAAPRGRAAILAALAAAGRGLAAAHDAGLVHRDVKPDNILVGDDGRVRVVDFGLVAPVGGVEAVDPDGAVDGAAVRALGSPAGDDGALTATGVAVGTPAFMAPEQRRGEAADAHGDQWSFAVTACVALTGARPTVHEAPPRVELPAGLGAGERRVLGRALALDPAARYPSMAALVDALAATAAPRRRARWMLIAAGIAAIAIAVALAVRVTRTPSHLGADRGAGRAALALATERAEQGDHAGAEAAAREAIRRGAQGQDDATLADAWTLLIRLLAEQDRLGEAVALRDVAEAAVARAGADPARRVRLLASLVELAMWTKDYAAVIARADRELPVLEAALGLRDPALIALVVAYAEALTEVGRAVDAWMWASRGLAAANDAFGRDDPRVIAARRVNGVTLLAVGQPEAARGHLARVAAWGDAHGPGHPDRYYGHTALGWSYTSTGELERAAAELARGRAAAEAAGGASDFRVSVVLAAQGDLEAMRGDLAAAEAAWAEALRIRRATRPARHLTIARALSGLGGVVLARGDPARAAALLEDAVAILAVDPTSLTAPGADLAVARLRLARARWDAGDRGAALVVAGDVLRFADPDAAAPPIDGAPLARWVIALCAEHTCPPP